VSATAKKPTTAATQDPKGGLTAAGRARFARTQGAHLKPGVTKPASEMTPEEMRRKGGWAARFYGRATLPPLRKPNGQPTRFALSAHAWGEKVPTTEAQARKIADKGRALLERYKALKAGR
jgi:hypothetical protein